MSYPVVAIVFATVISVLLTSWVVFW